MHCEDLVLISVDDHVVEPPDMFDGRLPRKYQDKAPRMVLREDGAHVWQYEDAQMETFALNAVVGRPPEEYGIEPQNYDEIRAGVYLVDERVKDMSANGAWAALNFPTFVGFAAPLFPTFAYRDSDQAMAMVRAYNDWHLEAWCGAYPDRLIPLGTLPFWDPALMVEEVRRLADLGCHAVTFMGDPYPFPSFYTDHWDPFWAACQDVGTVVCMHLGAGSGNTQMVAAASKDPKRPVLPPRPPQKVGLDYVGIFATPGSPPAVAADLLNSHIFERFTDLKIALSEGGIGWVPYFLEQADFRLRHHGPWTGMDFGGRLPSEIFKEHVVVCFIEDAAGIAARSLMNIDMITWECDYPHSDCTWPQSPETAAACLQGLPYDEIARITHRNAARIFQFDPFSKRSPEQCTVAALRREVGDHDISIVARGNQGRATRTEAGALVLGNKA